MPKMAAAVSFEIINLLLIGETLRVLLILDPIILTVKNSSPEGPGFGLPPRGAQDQNQRSVGVVE